MDINFAIHLEKVLNLLKSNLPLSRPQRNSICDFLHTIFYRILALDETKVSQVFEEYKSKLVIHDEPLLVILLEYMDAISVSTSCPISQIWRQKCLYLISLTIPRISHDNSLRLRAIELQKIYRQRSEEHFQSFVNKQEEEYKKSDNYKNGQRILEKYPILSFEIDRKGCVILFNGGVEEKKWIESKAFPSITSVIYITNVELQ